MIDPDARQRAVADAMAELGYDGIAAFDREEPEYDAFSTLHDQFDSESHLALLGICAGTADYQLAGDAQQFWQALEGVASTLDQLETIDDVRETLWTFMEADVNARLRNQKLTRLGKLFDRGFASWFVTGYGDREPVEVWERLAETLDNPPHKKTIVFAMKVYDIIHLIANDEYLDFPTDIPIPCDLHVERIADSAGIISKMDEETVRGAWASVAEGVSERLGRPVSLLRIDSIVWQVGQLVSENRNDLEYCRQVLVNHFCGIGIDEEPASQLAEELTWRL